MGIRSTVAWSMVLLVAGCADVPQVQVPDDAGLRLSCVDPCFRVVDDLAGTSMEPTLVLDPNDPQRLVAASFSYEADPPGPGAIWPRIHVSTDQGATWKTTALPRGAATDPTGIYPYNNAGDPALAFSRRTLVLAGIAAHGAGAGQSSAPNVLADYSVFIARSRDGGTSFEPPTILKRGVGSYNELLDMPGLAAGPDGTLLLTFTRFHVQLATEPARLIPSDVMFSTSTDDGTSWTDPALVEPRNNHWSAPLVASDGTWLVAMHGTLPTEASTDAPPQAPAPLRIARSTDRGATWTLIEVGMMADRNRPMLAQRNDGTVFLAYSESKDGDGVPAVRVSSDVGMSWSNPIVLDAASSIPPLTSVAIDAQGLAYVAWYAGAEGTMGYRVAAIVDGKVLEALTTERGFDAGVGQREYAGLVGLPSGAYAVYVAGTSPETDVHGIQITVERSSPA